MKTAIILGATGLTGGILLQKLIKDPGYSKVKVFTRTSVGLTHPKVSEQLLDLLQLDQQAQDFTGDVVFCCIGSTQKKTPDEEMYRLVDHGIPVTAARLAKKNGIGKFVVISALDANPNSRFFYNRTKGEMERDVLALEIPETYILQPALINGPRQEKRPFEFLWKKLMKVGDHLLLGRFRKYRSIASETIASAMVLLEKEGYFKERIESDEIKELVHARN